MEKPILVVGGHGMLGRPVVRRLLKDGFRVRALARRPERARGLLPGAVQIVAGDLEDVASLESAVQGCGAVYVSVDTPPGALFRAETDGLANLAAALPHAPGARLIVLSALGSHRAEAGRHPWWHAREKHEAQRIARGSGAPWTVLEPVWFLESLPLFVRNKTFWLLTGTGMASHWVAGDDCGRLLSRLLREGSGVGEVVPLQGAERLTLEEAARRFVAAYDPAIRVRRVPMALLRAAGVVSAQVRELVSLFDTYRTGAEPAPDPGVWARFGKPSMDVAAYARYARASGDFPRK